MKIRCIIDVAIAHHDDNPGHNQAGIITCTSICGSDNYLIQ
jgi:hypothetical protein